MSEVRLPEDAPLSGESLGYVQSHALAGLLVVAVVRGDGTILREPSNSETIQAGDSLAILGRPDDVAKAVRRIGGEVQMLYRGVRH